MRRLKWCLCLQIALLWFAGTAYGGDPARIAFRIDSLLAAMVPEEGFPGVSVAWVVGDSAPGHASVSSASRGSDESISPEHLLLAGSTGKTFAAAIALRRVDQGKLSLDDPVKSYLGGRDWYGRLPNGGGITVRHLLRHQTGIPEYVYHEDFLASLKADPFRSRKPEEQIAWILDAEPVFAPGEGFRYGDINYLLLGLILEQVDPRPVYQQIREDLTGPLKLDGIVPSNRRDIPGLAVGLAAENDPLGFPRLMVEGGLLMVNPDFEWMGGGMATRPSDLAVWIRWYARGEGLSESMRAAQRETVPATGVGGEYGLGIQKKELAGMEVWGHDGFFPGYYSQNIYLPAFDAALVLQYPSTDFNAMGQVRRNLLPGIAAILAEELGAE